MAGSGASGDFQRSTPPLFHQESRAYDRQGNQARLQPPPGPDPQRDKDTEMPKIKTHRGAAKRFRKTASGKYKAGHANRSHILTKMSTKRKRNLRQMNHIPACDSGRLDRMLPYL